MKRAHLAAVAALVVLAVPALTGCWNGQGATTTTQASQNSGNGVDAVAGTMHIEDATVVLGPEGSGSGTLLVRLVNTGPEADTLTRVTIDGVEVQIPAAGAAIGPGASVGFGYDSDLFLNTYALDAPAATYVPIVIGFEKAGETPMSVLTVPAVGYYAGIAPNPATGPAAQPSASAS